MKRVLKIAILIIIIFSIFILEESIRINYTNSYKPLIIIDKIMCSKDSFVCYGDDRKYEEEYLSLGFTLKLEYYLDPKSSEDNHMYYLVDKEFLLFNKFKIY